MLLSILFTLEQLKAAQCNTACDFVGFDGGFYQKETCLCYSKRDYKELVNRKHMSVTKKKEKIEPEKTDPYWRDHDRDD